MLVKQLMDTIQTAMLLLLLPVTNSFTQRRYKHPYPDIWTPASPKINIVDDSSYNSKLSDDSIPNPKHSRDYLLNRKISEVIVSNVPLSDNYRQHVIFPTKSKGTNSQVDINAWLLQSRDLRERVPKQTIPISKYGQQIRHPNKNDTKHINRDYRKTNNSVDDVKIDTRVGIDNTPLSAEKIIPLSRQRQTSQNNDYTNAMSSVKKRSLGDPSSCEMDMTDVDVSFKERVGAGETSYLLECFGQVRVNKCEGMCTSRISPSVTRYDGFLRDCSCCKEDRTIYRDVRLTACFIGNEETNGRALTRTIAEPSGCSCQICRN